MARLAGKSALVAGAGGGIGGAAAEGLAREGAAVVCGDVDLAAAEVTAEHIRAAGGRAAAIRLDVTDGDAVTAALHSVVANFGGVDILLNSAGVTMSASILALEQSEWDRVIAVNLTGAMRLGQAVARQMVTQKRGGSVIIVTSQLAEVAIPDKTAYLASKGGARSLVMGMAVDLAPHGIRVNAIGPGPTLTGLTRRRLADERIRSWTLERIPLGRLGEPADLVGAVLFLASDDSRWVTGTTIVVDGGYLAL